MGTNTPLTKLLKEQITEQPTSYISDWISVAKTSHKRHIPSVVAINPIEKNG